MPESVYVPVLKTRQGELAALGRLQPVTRASMIPLLEIVPPGLDDSTAVTDAIERLAKRLGSIWSGGELWLDAGLLPPGVPVTDGGTASAFAVSQVSSYGIGALPVVRLADDEQSRKDMRSLGETHGCGVAVRLSLEDMDEDPDYIAESLADLLRDLGISRMRADLVLDLAALRGDVAVRGGSRLVMDVLRDLEAIDDWRRIAVVSGAFPADLSVAQPWTLSEYHRYDATLWDSLIGRRRLPRVPMYGDYAVAHPLMASGPSFAPAPQLRYCLADRWLVLKGRKSDPRGNEQFYEVCDVIAEHPEFVGAALGYADERIESSRSHGPGNASTWREIGTIHHLDFVVRRITSLGEP